jgi:hypothetical protein
MFHIHATRRVARNALLSAVVAGTGLAGLLGATAGTAHASSKAVSGFATIASCGAVSGKITYSPGLLASTPQATNATMTGFVSNCTGEGFGQLTGFGKLTVQMSGNASKAAENFGSGTFTISWPSSASPSTGTLAVSETGGVEQLSGTVTSGPYTGGVIGAHYVITSSKGTGTAVSPVTSQTYINDTSLTVQENTG